MYLQKNMLMACKLQRKMYKNVIVFSNSPCSISRNIFNNRLPSNAKYMEIPKYEESFTIHLGSQIKQMHNIRIMASNVMEFCSISNTIEAW